MSQSFINQNIFLQGLHMYTLYVLPVLQQNSLLMHIVHGKEMHHTRSGKLLKHIHLFRILIVTLQFVLLRSVFFKHAGSTCNM